MRKAPFLLAVGFILITFFRVSSFLFYGMKLGWLGFSFALALTVGVYTASYFVRFKETKWIAIALLAIFGLSDLWFNEFEMVRSLSASQMVVPAANFLGFGAQSLTTAFHVSAIVYGALPTVFAAMLGLLQAQAEKVAVLRQKTFISQLGRAISEILARGIQATVAGVFGAEHFTALPSGNSGKSLTVSDDEMVVSGEISPVSGKIRWDDLKVADKEEIAAMTPRQIITHFPGVSARTARNWKQWIKDGK